MSVQDAAAEIRIREIGEKLDGQRKWLGGAFADDRIWGVPGHARRVLCIDPLLEKAFEIGPEVNRNGRNIYKYLRGIELNNIVYGIPMHASGVLRIEPKADGAEISILKAPHDNVQRTFQWHGGAVLKNSVMVTVPCNAGSVLRIENDTVSCFGSLPIGGNKWYGAVSLNEAAICMPFNASRVLRIFRDSVQLIGPDFGQGKAKYHGCVRAGNYVYGVPAHASYILRVDAEATVRCVGQPLADDNNHGKYKYGGAICANGAIYGIPCDACRIFKLELGTDAVTMIGPVLSTQKNKWQNAALGRDGRLYCAPCDENRVLCIDPYTDAISLYALPGLSPVADRFQGAYADTFGKVWFIPENAKRVCLVEPILLSDDFFRRKYLERLGLCPDSRPSLNTILCAHLAKIPFETIDAHDTREEYLPLSRSALFDRLIARRRGGDCFALNCGLFYLLQSLDFQVSFLPARVYAGPSRGRGPKMKPGFRAAPSHFALLVDNVHFVDAGLGEPPNGTLDFFNQVGETQITPDGMHSRFIPDNDTSSKRVLEWLLDGEWQPRLLLNPDHPRCGVHPTELEADRDYLRQASVPTPLNNKLIVSRLTPDSKITLTLSNSLGPTLKITSPRFGVQKRVTMRPLLVPQNYQLNTATLLAALRAALHEHFNIPYAETRGLSLERSLDSPEVWWDHL